MRPMQLPPPSGSGANLAHANNNNNKEQRPQHRRKDLTLPLPPAAAESGEASQQAVQQVIPFLELERLNRIGSRSGGMVYKVVHRTSGRVYTPKVIYGHHEESVRWQIHQEIHILRDVDDANVVKFHETYD
ncbi:hypothetical protein JHK85_010663 [Glycine max]|nr:hypothetical protein JHK85_010663 [Glycine max]